MQRSNRRIRVCIGNVSPWQRSILENRFDSDERYLLLGEPTVDKPFQAIAENVDLRLVGFNAAKRNDSALFSSLLESSASIPTIALMATSPKETLSELPRQIKDRVLIPTDLNDRVQSVAHFLLALETAMEHAMPKAMDSEKPQKKKNSPNSKTINAKQNPESASPVSDKPVKKSRPRIKAPDALPTVLVIGSSTGGPKALQILLQSLPADIHVPIVVAQHMPSTFTKSLAKQLDQNTHLCVEEAQDKDVLKPGHVYIAPGDRHLRLKRKSPNEVNVQISDEKPVNFCRPSVDVLFRSAALEYGSRCIAVVLTGMGMDGFAGSTVLSECGASIVVQDEETSVVWGMPGNIAAAGLANHVLGIEEIGGILTNMLSSKCPI